jgi:hypothetical protein
MMNLIIVVSVCLVPVVVVLAWPRAVWGVVVWLFDTLWHLVPVLFGMVVWYLSAIASEEQEPNTNSSWNGNANRPYYPGESRIW